MANYKRGRSRRQQAGCACCGSHRHLGNNKGRLKAKEEVVEPEESKVGPRRSRKARVRKKPWIIYVLWPSSSYQPRSSWRVWRRYITEDAARYAAKQLRAHYKNSQFRVENEP